MTDETQERWREKYYDKVHELSLAEARVTRLSLALKWIMPKVHQAHHEGEFDSCQKSTCVEYREAMI
jgi:hypothetical protein